MLINNQHNKGKILGKFTPEEKQWLPPIYISEMTSGDVYFDADLVRIIKNNYQAQIEPQQQENLQPGQNLLNILR